MQFPIFKTKIERSAKKFNLTDPVEQEEYFELKAGSEIQKIKDYLKTNTFVAYLLGKKNSGKGTYAKMFGEIVGKDKVEHLSVGDMIRNIDKELQNPETKKELIAFLEKNYRGRLPLAEITSALARRSTKTLLPTELILALVKREIAKKEKKAVFIDGFPRDLDQINFSLFFRDLIGYREDPDIFVLIDVPTAVIDERIKWRRVCPVCQTSRNLKLLLTSKVGYREKTKEFYLICDNPECQEAEMLPKEGDKAGIKPIKKRLKMDEKLIGEAFSLYGIPKILLRNSVPQKSAQNYVDDYEITPEYSFDWDEKNKKVKIIERPWLIKDSEGIRSYSLLAQPVVVSLIKQTAKVLNL
ncbi:MAG: nucleoside monophosphate kinase [bacterium]